LVVVGVVSAAVFSGVAEVSGLAFASAVAAGTLTALEASVLTMIIAGATAGVAGGVASRILAVVEGDLDPKEIWTLRGVLTDAAIGAVFTVASHAVAAKIAKLVALHQEGGVPALRARLAELIAERKVFARQERGSVGLPGSAPVSTAGNPGPKPSNSGGPSNTVPVRPASSASTVPLLGDDLAAAQKANTLVESLTATGALPPNFVTKAQAKALGWVEGKAIGNYLPDGQIGGDIFKFPESIGLPAAPGRIWFEADVDLISTITRKKQPGIRLLFSSDGLAFVSPDHYRRTYRLTDWK
jgi:ribonuclease